MWRCIHLKDGIIAETKNSRLLKADLPATYDELVALAANAGIQADVLFNAAGWQQIPTFLNKKTLLQDSTAGLLGLTGDPTVDDAFVAMLLTARQMALVRVMVTIAGTPAIADIEITGLEGVDGGAVYTDASGAAVGFAPAGEVSISTPTYQDLPAAPAVTRELAAGEIVDVSLVITSVSRAGDKSITSTTSGIRFSPYVTEVDVCCVGGGGGGGAGYSQWSGGCGGGGGYVENKLNAPFSTKVSYQAVIGAGGKGAICASTPVTGSDGGTSSFMGVSADGGKGGQGFAQLPGAGNGRGGNSAYYSGGAHPAEAGSPGTTRAFNDPSDELYGGGGGGSGAGGGYPSSPESSMYPGGTGGATYGGSGATVSYSLYRNQGEDAKGPGGGGGGGYNWWQNQNQPYKTGGDGYAGLVRYRWRVA